MRALGIQESERLEKRMCGCVNIVAEEVEIKLYRKFQQNSQLLRALDINLRNN